MIIQVRKRLTSQYPDRTLMYPGVWVFTWARMVPGVWVLIAVQPETEE